MNANGYGAWHNNYGAGAGQATSVELARAKQTGFVIAKAGYWPAFNAFKAAGVRLGVEVYAMPNKAAEQAALLIDGLNRGAKFIVINAEVEWESQPAGVMRAFLNRLPANAEVYSCTDTRGGRMQLPYQVELSQRCTGYMPMIYPLAFAQTVENAFRSALDTGQNFGGKPVLPAIQTYGAPGPSVVLAQVRECKRRGLLGCQAYTLNEGHPTALEWAAYAEATAPPPQEEDDMQIIPLGQFAEKVPHEVSYFVFIDANGNIKANKVDGPEQWGALVAANFPVKKLVGVSNIPAA